VTAFRRASGGRRRPFRAEGRPCGNGLRRPFGLAAALSTDSGKAGGRNAKKRVALEGLRVQLAPFRPEHVTQEIPRA
jgi:hypothetical protein